MTQRPVRWLATPSRCAGLGRVPARVMLGLVIVLTVIATIWIEPVPGALPEFLHDAIVATIRHGGNYYDAASDLLRTDPDAHAARLLPPGLAMVDAALPGWAMAIVVAGFLAALLWIGGLRLGALFGRTAGVVMVASLLAVGLSACAILWMAAPHAAAAAILSGLAIVARTPGRWTAACALAATAAMLDPAALIVVAVMALFALRDGARGEAGAWVVAGLAAAIVLGVHLWALNGVPIHPGDDPLGGLSLSRLTAACFPDIPTALAAPLLVLASFGWATIGDAIGARVVAVIVAGIALDGVFGLRSATLPVALVASGLAFAPGAIADLLRAAIDRRRITVTRIVR